MICWNHTITMIILQDKWKYSKFDTFCQRVWIHITKIRESHIHKNTVMSNEHTVILQSSMQFVPTMLPIIVLRRVEEPFPAYREIMVSAVCLCTDNRIISFYPEDLCGPKNKMFSSILILPFVLCDLRF